MPAIVRYPGPGVLSSFRSKGAQIYISIPWAAKKVNRYQEVVVDLACRIKCPPELKGDYILDVVSTLGLKVAPSGFPFFQSFYALTNCVTGEKLIAKT